MLCAALDTDLKCPVRTLCGLDSEKFGASSFEPQPVEQRAVPTLVLLITPTTSLFVLVLWPSTLKLHPEP